MSFEYRIKDQGGVYLRQQQREPQRLAIKSIELQRENMVLGRRISWRRNI